MWGGGLRDQIDQLMCCAEWADVVLLVVVRYGYVFPGSKAASDMS